MISQSPQTSANIKEAVLSALENQQEQKALRLLEEHVRWSGKPPFRRLWLHRSVFLGWWLCHTWFSIAVGYLGAFALAGICDKTSYLWWNVGVIFVSILLLYSSAKGLIRWSGRKWMRWMMPLWTVLSIVLYFLA